MKPLIIGLGYRARSGKDTVGTYLVEKYGFKRISLADKIREIASILTGMDAFDLAFKTSSAMCHMSGGQLLQVLGIKLREIDPDILMKAAGMGMITMQYPRVVITDVRFLNEASMIHMLGGVLWCIMRPGLPQDDHISEQEGKLINWNSYIPNDATVQILQQRIDIYVESFISEPPAPYTSADEQGTQRALQGLE